MGRRFEVGVENVKVGPNREDALRIKKTVPVGDGPLICVDCEEEIKETVIEGTTYKVVQIVSSSRKKYAEDVCYSCQKKRKEAEITAAEAEAAEKAAEQVAETEETEGDAR